MKYYTDGFTIDSNPSEEGGGYVITDENGNLIHREVIKKRGFTNNEGEVRGILHALQFAQQNDSVSTDSMCCLAWVNKGRSKARPDLNFIFDDCQRILKSKKVNLMWEGREFNKAGWINESEKGRY